VNKKASAAALPQWVRLQLAQLVEGIASIVLVSVFPNSGRVNSWLHWKQWLQALPGRAGGAVVIATVDHTLMRGSKPHDRLCVASCLGLGTCVDRLSGI
jgi:hypothetical protein